MSQHILFHSLVAALQGSTLLYQPGSFPTGVMCPVRFLWRPSGDELLVWVHPAASRCFQEHISVVVASLRVLVVIKAVQGSLLRFRVLGTAALAVLQSALVAAPSDIVDSACGQRVWSSLAQLSSAASLPAQAVIGTVLLDPRTRCWRTDASVQPALLDEVVRWCLAWPAAACDAPLLWDEAALKRASELRCVAHTLGPAWCSWISFAILCWQAV